MRHRDSEPQRRPDRLVLKGIREEFCVVGEARRRLREVERQDQAVEKRIDEDQQDEQQGRQHQQRDAVYATQCEPAEVKERRLGSALLMAHVRRRSGRGRGVDRERRSVRRGRHSLRSGRSVPAGLGAGGCRRTRGRDTQLFQRFRPCGTLGFRCCRNIVAAARRALPCRRFRAVACDALRRVPATSRTALSPSISATMPGIAFGSP